MGASRDEEFTAFVRARGTSLFRLACLLTGDPSQGEDLLQGVLEKAYRRWAQVGLADAPEAYVRQALVHSARSLWKTRARSRFAYSGTVPDIAIRGGQEALELRHSLMDALNSLTRQQRAVIVLRYFADQDEAQTARLLGCSVGTVKAHASRGLQRLRANFQLADFSSDLCQEER